MAHDNDGFGKGLFVGFLAGSVVGAVFALLYAPKKGEELRADIKKRTGEFAGDAEEYLERARKRAVDIVNEGKERSQTLISEARRRAESLMDDAHRIMEEAKKPGKEPPRS